MARRVCASLADLEVQRKRQRVALVGGRPPFLGILADSTPALVSALEATAVEPVQVEPILP